MYTRSLDPKLEFWKISVGIIQLHTSSLSTSSSQMVSRSFRFLGAAEHGGVGGVGVMMCSISHSSALIGSKHWVFIEGGFRKCPIAKVKV